MIDITLRPIKESTEEYEEIEKRIKKEFRRAIYEPILKELGESKKTLTNSIEDLYSAIQSGRLTYNRGTFSGKLNARLTKELKSLGARFDRRSGTFKINLAEIPLEVRNVISASSLKFEQRLEKIDKKLSEILPEEIAEKIKTKDMFDRTLFKVDRDFRASVKGLTVSPKLSKTVADKLSSEWQNNMDIWIKDFTQKEISSLREKIQESAFAGNRYESAVKSIQESFGVTERKAKFLARQETALLLTQYKESRYQDAGVHHYKWRCVAGSPAHPVRPRHKELSKSSDKGNIFRFDDPPIASEPGQPVVKANPGTMYNCRCTAIPVIKFNK